MSLEVIHTGIDIAAEQLKLPSATAVSILGASSCPDSSISNPASCKGA